MKVLLFILGLTIGATLCGCQSVPPKSIRHLPQIAAEVCNNSYSLLYELLNEEKNVSKLLIIKRDSRELNHLIKDISTTSGQAAEQLSQFERQDAAMVLTAKNLPLGETATREAIATTKKKELLGSSGDNFERSLLLTQIQALNYAAHLALVAAENDTNPNRSAWAKSLSQEMKRLYSQCVELLSRTPHGP